MAPTREDVGDLLGGRYRLRRWLGAGGMGTVWAADDERLHRRVAVKVVRGGGSGDPVALQRFEREAQTAARLVHPNLATVFDYGQDGDEVYLVMELLDGESLGHRLRRTGPLPEAEVRSVGADVAEGLAALHDAGIVHRDVKPGNVVLTEGGACLVDFGIASGIGAPLTATGMVVGTASFLSPERVQGQGAGPASDVYALGAVLYEAATGERAFPGGTPSEAALAHLHGEPPGLADPDAADPPLPSALVGPLQEALAKDPSARPSATRLVALLEGTTEPVAPALGPAAAPTLVDATEVAAPPPLLAVDPTPSRGIPAPRGGPERRRPPVPRPLLVAAALALLFLVAAFAWSSSRDGAGGAATKAGAAVPAGATTTTPATAVGTTAPPATTSTAPPTTAAPPSATSAALAALLVALAEAEAAGDLEGRDARAIGRSAEQAVAASDQGDARRAHQRLDDAERRLDAAADDDGAPDQVIRALADLRAAVVAEVGGAPQDGPGGGPPETPGGGGGPGPGDDADEDDD